MKNFKTAVIVLFWAFACIPVSTSFAEDQEDYSAYYQDLINDIDISADENYTSEELDDIISNTVKPSKQPKKEQQKIISSKQGVYVNRNTKNDTNSNKAGPSNPNTPAIEPNNGMIKSFENAIIVMTNITDGSREEVEVGTHGVDVNGYIFEVVSCSMNNQFIATMVVTQGAYKMEVKLDSHPYYLKSGNYFISLLECYNS